MGEIYSLEEKMSDPAAERAVLCGLLQYGEDAYLDVADFLCLDSFTDPLNQIIYKCVKNLYENQGVRQFDQSSILACAGALGYAQFLEKSTDIQHLRSLFNGRVLLENVRTWAAQIRKLQIGRMLRDQLRQAAYTIEDIQGTESIDAILGIAESVVFDFSTLLHNNESSQPKLLGLGVHEYLDYIEANPVQIVGISSGMPYYDQAIGGGFRRKTVSLIGARSKVGKSFVAITMGRHISQNIGIPVLYLDTEMCEEDHWSRTLPSICYENGVQVTINELETGQYKDSEFKRKCVRRAADILNEIPFHYLNVSGKPFEEILSIMRRWVTKEVGVNENGVRNDCVIIYDYMKMMSGESLNDSLKEYQVLGFMTTALHNFAFHYDIPVLSFIQLNRDGIDRETTDVISGSDRILWLVTNFTIFKEKSVEEIADAGPQHGNRKFVPVSARHGQGIGLGDYINVHFYGRYGHIKEGETKANIRSGRGGIVNTDDNVPNEVSTDDNAPNEVSTDDNAVNDKQEGSQDNEHEHGLGQPDNQ